MQLLNTFATTKSNLGKPYIDFEYLLQALKVTLEDNGEAYIASQIPLVNEAVNLSPDNITPQHLQLYSLLFKLINLCEINWAVQHRRKIEEARLTDATGLWADTIAKLLAAGKSADEILNALPEVHMEPVLTAHPTEAKRATVLEHYRELYLLLVQRENNMYNRYEMENIRFNIQQTLYRLWKTGEIYLEKPEVED